MSKYKVLIDIGHGGTDTGAVSINKELEKNINLEVANYLKEMAKKYSDEITFIYTRDKDITISLEQRVLIANTEQVNLAISIHHNASGSGAEGAEVIHSVGGGKGKEMAELVMKEFLAIGQNKRRVFAKESNTDKNKDYYFFIRYTNMPSIITEYSFLDSKDFYDIDSKEERVNQAKAILKAILKYFNVAEKVDKVEKKVEAIVDNKVEQWKLDLISNAFNNNIITDLAQWTNKINEPMPVWAVLACLNNLLNNINKK